MTRKKKKVEYGLKEAKKVEEALLPDEYIPSSLRPVREERKETIYACAYQHKPGSFGLYAGPYQKVKDALETVPDQPYCNPCIVIMRKDGTDDVLYHWAGHKWVKGEPKVEPTVGELDGKDLTSPSVRLPGL